MKERLSLGPILYGGLFVVALPVLLFLWAWRTGPFVPLPALDWPVAGWLVVAVGVALMGAGMTALRVHGGGLPMNAYPPPAYVDRGVYRLLGHPIYVGGVRPRRVRRLRGVRYSQRTLAGLSPRLPRHGGSGPRV
jgi:hypothetical protein